MFTPIVLLLVSCAQSSGVLKMGPDTYTVSMHAAPARGGQSGAKKLAFKEANNHCANLGKEILVTNESTYPSTHFAGGTCDLTFQCLDENDPSLKRPRYEKPADIVIKSE